MKLLTAILIQIFFISGAFAQVLNDPFKAGATAFAEHEGGVQGGGGDTETEMRIKEIRDDLLKWISLGGASEFDFQNRLTQSDYENGNASAHIFGMKEVLLQGAVIVNVIEAADQDLKNELKNTFVNGARKICKGIFSAKLNHRSYIICEKESFQAMKSMTVQKEDLQYRLVHHEYASLAGIERNLGSDSDYFLSEQVLKSLRTTVTRKLAIRPKIKFRKMEFLPVKAKGVTFIMGSPKNEVNRNQYNEDQRSITFTEDFEMQTTPVTQAQWISLMGYNRSNARDWWFCEETHIDELGGYCPNHPVETVSFEEICGSSRTMHFGKKGDRLNPFECGQYSGFVKKMNELEDGCVYRLPTDAEYEYVTRAGTAGAFFSGAQAQSLLDYAWIGEPAGLTEVIINGVSATGGKKGMTHDVGTRKANAWGFFDMIGNVAEWTFDHEQTEERESGDRPVKGAPYLADLKDGRSASVMNEGDSQHRENTTGFRLVRSCRK